MKTAIRSPEALAALNALRPVGFAKRPALQAAMAKTLGRDVSDAAFDLAMAELSSRVIRVRGTVGAGIYLA